MFEKLYFKKAEKTDIDYLFWLRNETMSNHMSNSGVEVTEKKQLDRINYNFEDAKIIYFDDEKIGLLKTTEKEFEIEVVQIQLDPKYHGKGLGNKIMQSIIEQAKAKNKTIFLSVLKANPAKKLYDRLGFLTEKETENSFEMRLIV